MNAPPEVFAAGNDLSLLLSLPCPGSPGLAQRTPPSSLLLVPFPGQPGELVDLYSGPGKQKETQVMVGVGVPGQW